MLEVFVCTGMQAETKGGLQRRRYGGAEQVGRKRISVISSGITLACDDIWGVQ